MICPVMVPNVIYSLYLLNDFSHKLSKVFALLFSIYLLAFMKKKFALLVFLTALLSGVYVWFFIYNKSHANIHEEDIAFDGTSIELKEQFLRSDGSLDSSLLDKVVIIHGNVSESESKSYILDESIVCHLDSTLSADPSHQNIRVKGRLHGTIDDIIYGDIIVIEHAVFHLE